MKDIKDYIEKKFNFDEFIFNDDTNIEGVKNYFYNAKADAIYCYNTIAKYLARDKKILEVGGGIHLLTNFLNENYQITSVEPGGFIGWTDELRNQILKKKKIDVHNTTLEDFNSPKKFDFIFSMNVLEHTKDISLHIESCIKLLKDENSILFIQCPNYSFPFEPHFYEFFIPFFPKLTFKKIKKKKLIKKLGERAYNKIFDNLNFECNYKNIKKLDFNINFKHPVKEIFTRILNDSQFKNRILDNFFVRIIYKIITFCKLEKIICFIFPKSISPYLPFEIKNAIIKK